jgi:hypothetical protein
MHGSIEMLFNGMMDCISVMWPFLDDPLLDVWPLIRTTGWMACMHCVHACIITCMVGQHRAQHLLVLPWYGDLVTFIHSLVGSTC